MDPAPQSRRSMDSKVYRVSGGRALSMSDLLKYFSHAGTLRVSDLHLKVGCPPTYRLDGQLQPMKGPPLDEPTVSALLETLLLPAEIELLQSRRSLDGSVFTEGLQFRLNCFYDMDGPAVAIRALDAKAPRVEGVGFPNDVWRDIVVRQHGLVLVTGITGAGKSTTIAALIAHIARTRPCRIITLEDPIEYRLASERAMISQREVGRDVPDFARGLRDCLREDPDVIFVGEMRDLESATWTLTAAETGHLVFSTLHTRDTRGAVTRLLDMFPPSRQDEVASQLSLGLAYVIAQKLIPRADGTGRVAAMEIMNNTPAVANIIRTQKVEQLYTQLQTRCKDIASERMVTMERSLAMLVAAETVTEEEARKWAHDVPTFDDELARA
ncbi:MAG: PilT/PilU family type 4a pilus ATPase [Planctomycetaceae bacterium]|nr:PilT/PilU family type 4a pilus ATPase [Planctomycetaceae bacterium]